jgi:branched-chain amino acid transport system substrate-binding protein
MPNDMQAGVHAGVLHYLKAVDKVGNAEDGRKLHPMNLFQVKSPEESKEQWDCFKMLASVPADRAFRPMSEGRCPLVTNK